MVRVEIVAEEGKSTKEIVAEEIATFEKWFQKTLQNADPLTRHERAILNDYLGYRAGEGRTS